MENDSFEYILNRSANVAVISEHFADQAELLREIVNYGTYLIPRCFNDSGRRVTDVVLLPVLLKHLIAMLDAVEIAVSNGALFAAYVPARSFFEVFLYIEWILDDDAVRRARQYYVWHLRQKRRWDRCVIKGSKERNGILKTFEHLGPEFVRDLDSQEAKRKKEIREIDRLLRSPTYREINKEFENRRRGYYDVSWYVPFGPRSLAKMATDLGRKADYLVLYQQGSLVTHGTDFSKHVKIRKDHVVYEPIRHLNGIKPFLQIVIGLSITAFRDVLDYYRPDEVQRFRRKYAAEWRKRFLSILDVDYKTQLVGF